MRRVQTVWLLSLFAISTSRAQSVVDAPTAVGLTLSQAVALALRHNLDVRTARSTIDSASAEGRIARAIPNPLYIGSPNSPYQYGASIPLDVGPQRLYRVRVSTFGIAAANLDARDVQRQVTLSVQRAFYDVLLSDAQRALVISRRTLLAQLHLADSARVRAGDIPERNLTRSAVELARADADLVHATLDAENTRLSLQALLGATVPDAALALDGTLSTPDVQLPGLDTLLARAARDRPDLAAAQRRIEQGRARRNLAAASLIPIPELTYVRQFSAPFESGRYYSLGLQLEVPIFNMYRGQRERADAANAIAGYANERIVAQAQRDVTSTRQNALAQQSIVQQLTGALSDAVDRNVTAAEYAYAHGATSLLDVLDAVRAQQELRSAYLLAVHDYWVALFMLDAAVAMPTSRIP